jgi:hypothetical protein
LGSNHLKLRSDEFEIKFRLKLKFLVFTWLIKNWNMICSTKNQQFFGKYFGWKAHWFRIKNVESIKENKLSSILQKCVALIQQEKLSERISYLETQARSNKEETQTEVVALLKTMDVRLTEMTSPHFRQRPRTGTQWICSQIWTEMMSTSF